MALSFCTYCNRYHDEAHVGAPVLNDLRNGFVPPSPRAVKLLSPGRVRPHGRDVVDLEPGVREQVASLIAHGRNRKLLCQIANLYTNQGDFPVAARLAGAAHGATIDQYALEPASKLQPVEADDLSTRGLVPLSDLILGIRHAVRSAGDRGNALRFAARLQAIHDNLRNVKTGGGVACVSDQTDNPPSPFWG